VNPILLSNTLAEDPAMSSDAVQFGPSPIASCTVATFIGAVFRYAFETSTALPGANGLPPSLRVSRPAALMGSFDVPFAGLFPRMGGEAFLSRPGPRVASTPRVPLD
jgi:hypothetical protein